jgi:hypothetical protein
MTDSIKISTQLYQQLNYDPYYFRTHDLLPLLGKYVYEDQFGEYGKNWHFIVWAANIILSNGICDGSHRQVAILVWAVALRKYHRLTEKFEPDKF